MKIRLGFVTNSSSSSFICEICGEAISGWDMCLSDADMSRCENGHEICNDHIDEDKHREAIEKRFYKETRAILEERQYKDSDLMAYLSKNNKTIEDILKLSVEEIETLFQSKLDWNAADDSCYLSKKEYISIEDRPEYGFFKEMGPLCMHDEITDKELVDFAVKKLDITKEELEQLTREALIAEDNK